MKKLSLFWKLEFPGQGFPRQENNFNYLRILETPDARLRINKRLTGGALKLQCNSLMFPISESSKVMKCALNLLYMRMYLKKGKKKDKHAIAPAFFRLTPPSGRRRPERRPSSILAAGAPRPPARCPRSEPVTAGRPGGRPWGLTSVLRRHSCWAAARPRLQRKS